MTPLETFLSFLVVISMIFGLPVIALINRKNSPIGKALGEVIRRRSRRHRMALPETQTEVPESQTDLKLLVEKQQELLSLQQKELSELNDKLDFLQRLIDTSQNNPDKDGKMNPEEQPKKNIHSGN